MSFLGFRFNFGRPFLAATTVYCEICMEHVPSTSSFKTTAHCKHSYCRRCLSPHISVTIADGVANVWCPSLECRAKLDPLRCKELLSSRSFLTWCDILFKLYVLRFVRCYCPNSNCREPIVDECQQSGNVKRFECPICRQSGCFQCASAWVEGHRCRGRHDVDISLFERLADRKKWVQCPNCHIYVERNGGCDQIYCRCKTVFCYRCGWESGKFRCLCQLSGTDNHWEACLIATCVFLLIAIFITIILIPAIGYLLSDREAS